MYALCGIALIEHVLKGHFELCARISRFLRDDSSWVSWCILMRRHQIPATPRAAALYRLWDATTVDEIQRGRARDPVFFARYAMPHQVDALRELYIAQANAAFDPYADRCAPSRAGWGRGRSSAGCGGTHPQQPSPPAMHPQSAKAKGRRLQQQVAKDVLAAFPHLEGSDVRSTSMGCGGEDVQLSAAAREAFPYSIECKNTERFSVWPALEQCERNAGKHQPLVVFKKNNKRAYAVVRWDHFVALVSGGAAKRVRPHPPAASDTGSSTPVSSPADLAAADEPDQLTRIEAMCTKIYHRVETRGNKAFE